ncbi:hypothetical protein MMC26_003414 [Xylographa opegraphella]|nr:hypothetical protein [Xylographa opegraphella]
MEDEGILSKVQDLTDVELALLLCLVANQHCIVETIDEAVDRLEDEIQLIASNVFGLSVAVVQCSRDTTLEDFSSDILISDQTTTHDDPNSKKNRKNSLYRHEMSSTREESRLPNVIIASNLSLAVHQVQIQALELLRTGRIFTHTAVYSVPKPFLLVLLDVASGTPLVKHLNDHVFLSHYHDPEDGFANIEEGSEWIEDDRASLSSVVHKSVARNHINNPLIDLENIELLSYRSRSTKVSVEVKRYLHDIITFLRRHHAVASGITPLASKHFELLARSLAPVHGLDFVTPSLVQLAARKVYRHRIVIVEPEDERSMQYGSDLAAVRALLESLTPDRVIEEVLESIEVPL